MGARTHTLATRLLRQANGEGCIDWTGARNSAGYGRVGSEDEGGNAVNLYTHRAMWEVVNGKPVPEGMQVMHTCDRPSCIAPWHLKLGTRQENIADRDVKGRTFKGSRKHEGRLTPDAEREYQNAAQRRRRAKKAPHVDQTQGALRTTPDLIGGPR